jgi:hypothetical protein
MNTKLQALLVTMTGLPFLLGVVAVLAGAVYLGFFHDFGEVRAYTDAIETCRPVVEYIEKEHDRTGRFPPALVSDLEEILRSAAFEHEYEGERLTLWIQVENRSLEMEWKHGRGWRRIGRD